VEDEEGEEEVEIEGRGIVVVAGRMTSSFADFLTVDIQL
jgi:hypothetical protein